MAGNRKGKAPVLCGRPVCVREDRRRNKQLERGKRHQIKRYSPNPMSVTSIGKRDLWECHVCGESVDRSFLDGRDWNHRLYPTVDHLIPVEAVKLARTAELLRWMELHPEQGLHDPENLRLAHKGCNSRRGWRGAIDLILLGQLDRVLAGGLRSW